MVKNGRYYVCPNCGSEDITTIVSYKGSYHQWYECKDCNYEGRSMYDDFYCFDTAVWGKEASVSNRFQWEDMIT